MNYELHELFVLKEYYELKQASISKAIAENLAEHNLFQRDQMFSGTHLKSQAAEKPATRNIKEDDEVLNSLSLDTIILTGETKDPLLAEAIKEKGQVIKSPQKNEEKKQEADNKAPSIDEVRGKVTDSDIKQLHARGMTTAEIANQINRTWPAVSFRLKKLGLTPHKVLTKADEERNSKIALPKKQAVPATKKPDTSYSIGARSSGYY